MKTHLGQSGQTAAAKTILVVLVLSLSFGRAAFSAALNEDFLSLSDLIAGLKSGDQGMRLQSAIALNLAGSMTASTIARLHEGLENLETRERAAFGLRWLAPKLYSEMDLVAGFLNDPDPAVRAEARRMLVCFGDALQAEIAALRTALKSPDANVRIQAIDALREMGIRSQETDLVLRPFLSDADIEVRLLIVKILGQNAALLTTVSDLANEFAEASPSEKNKISKTLGSLAAGVKKMTESLRVTLEDGDARIRKESSRILDQILPSVVSSRISLHNVSVKTADAHLAKVLKYFENSVLMLDQVKPAR